MKFKEFFDFMEACWNINYGSIVRRKWRGHDILELSTGGWSENEETLNQARTKFKFEWWASHVKWETGGHYWFRNPICELKKKCLICKKTAEQSRGETSSHICKYEG